MTYSQQERRKIIKTLAEAVKDGLTPFVEAARQHGACWQTVYDWLEHDSSLEDVAREFDVAKQIRAAAYVDEGRRILDDVQVFYRTEGSRDEIKDSVAAVNKAKYQCDVRFRLAECLDPSNWSSLKDEIKQIQAELKELKTALVAQLKK